MDSEQKCHLHECYQLRRVSQDFQLFQIKDKGDLDDLTQCCDKLCLSKCVYPTEVKCVTLLTWSIPLCQCWCSGNWQSGKEWRSQDIADARAQMGMLCLYELLRKVEKHLGGLGHAPPEKFFWISQPPRSVLKPYRSAVYITYTANLRTVNIRDS